MSAELCLMRGISTFREWWRAVQLSVRMERRREPLIGLLGCCAHVQNDGGREPGTRVLRPLRGVRGPGYARDVSAWRPGRARTQGWMGPCVLPERLVEIAQTGWRLCPRSGGR